MSSGFLELCSDCSFWVQAFSLITGIVYMVMQVTQHRWMWYFGIFTAAAALVVALSNCTEAGEWAPLWAQVMLNSYFLAMDIVGIFKWRKIESRTGDALHIVPMPKNRVLAYALIALVGGPVLCLLFSLTNDPAPVAEGISFCLSIIAQIMLTRSHLEQWFVWMAADLVCIIIYAEQGAWWMVGLYYAYLLNSCIGVYYWRRHGTYVR